MPRLLLAAFLLTFAGTIGGSSPRDLPRDLPSLTWRNPDELIDLRDWAAESEPQIKPICPDTPHRVVEIREADSTINKTQHDLMRRRLIESVNDPNTTILLGPKVVLDFTDAKDDELPLRFGPCVTLRSVSGFGETETKQSARTPRSLGPLLKFGPHRSNVEKVFLKVACVADRQPNDGVRISGFRLHGPSFDQQSTEEIGIHIVRCLDVEVSNMEIAGWGGQGIQVLDDAEQGPGQESPNNRPGERIGRPEQVRIFRNYFHHNQHPREGIFDTFAAGYGVDVHHGAWARITENVFDFNRHAIAAAGDTGGYEARRNLVLKGGGVHFNTGFTIYTHQFDVHGSGGNGFGGQASIQDWYSHNAFQYRRGPAIKIRGRPRIEIDIRDNIFAHQGLEDDRGDDAIHVDNRHDLDVIKIGPRNVSNFDSYGSYGVCDFDGDRIDDLFLATGKTWWFSSSGEFQWSYLGARTQRLNQVRLGYFDADLRCDVLVESRGQWLISSAGSGPWRSIGAFGVPLSEVAFGRFDPSVRDHRPGVNRRTTHAFRRAPNGEWLVTALSAVNWQHAQSSSLPMSKLRFGDFTGDGVTDVLAIVDRRWAISESAHSPWRNLNPDLSNEVSSLFIVDLSNDNIDDLIRLELTEVDMGLGGVEETFTWWVSDDGHSRWRRLKTYKFRIFKAAFIANSAKAPPAIGLVGRFGVAPGGGVLMIDHSRLGHFFSEAEVTAGAAPDWMSLFAY